MMILVNWIMSFGLSQKAAKLVLILVAVVVVCAGFVGIKAYYDHQIISKHDAEVNVQILQKQAPANDTAAEARASDTIKLHEKEQERTDAIAKETSAAPTDADLALNCRRLREAGYDTSNFPACRGR